MKFRHIIIGLLAVFIAFGCSTVKSGNDSNADILSEQAAEHRITDYSQARNWSVISSEITRPIDVFFVHPTTYGSKVVDGKYNADVNDAELNAATDSGVVNRITEAFSDSCNVFAPRYQQVNIEVLGMEGALKDKYLSIAVADVEAAFRYYLEHLNGGRPFILASHSQGSNVLQRILLADPGIINHDKLVAAYLVGWTFTKEQLDVINFKLSESPDQVGAFMTWNTIGPGGKSPTLFEGAVCVNPLSWNTKPGMVSASHNIGAKILSTDGTIKEIVNFTSAGILASGGLEIPIPSPEIASLLDMSMDEQCYHRYDYDFFFYNVKENVKQRCEAYIKRMKK